MFIPFLCISCGVLSSDKNPSIQPTSKKNLLRKSLGHHYFNKIEIPSKTTKKKLRRSQGQIFNKEEIIEEIPEKKEQTTRIYTNPLYKNTKDIMIFYQIPTKPTYVSKSQFDSYKKLHSDQHLIQRQTYSNQGKKIVCAWEIDQHADLYKELLY